MTNNLPKSYSAAKLEDIVDILDSRRIPINAKEREQRKGPFPYFGATGQVGWIDDYLFNEELVLLGEDGAPFLDPVKTKAYIIRRKSWVNNHAHVLRARGGIPSAYIKHYLDIVDYHQYVTGTTRLKLNQGAMRQIKVPIAPLNEQKRIVAEIEKQFSRLDEAVENLKRVKAKLKRYKAAVLKAAVEGKLTEKWRAENPDAEPASELLERILTERRKIWEEAELAKMKAKGKKPKDDKWKKKYKEPFEPDHMAFPNLPDGWCLASVEQLASDEERSIQSGPFGSNLLHSEFQETGKLALGIDNVQDGYFSIGAENRVSETKYKKLKKYAARPGDVLITVMSTIGRTCVVPEDIEPAIITKHVYRITVNREIVSSYYLHLTLWGGPVVLKQIQSQIRGQTRPGLNGPIIKQLVIPVPPLAEQGEILKKFKEKMSVIDRLLPKLEKFEIRALNIRQSILKQAFAGRLVPQDPIDESAGKLLERIKAEKEMLKEELTKKRKKRKNTMTPKESAKEKRDILQVLREAEGPMRPEDLFRMAGYKLEKVEEFYSEMKMADREGAVLQDKKKNGDVFLRLS